MKNSKKGISLIVLIVTMVVIVILSIAVILSMQDNNPISNANEAVVINDVASFKDELQMYIAKQVSKSRGGFKVGNLNATETSLEFNNSSQEGNIYTIIPSLGKKEEYKSMFEVYEGKLVYINEDTELEKIVNEVGVDRKINKFKFTINTAIYNATDKTFFVPFTPSSSRSYDFTINWGDGSDTTIASIEAINELNCTHSYSKAGVYTIAISSPNDKMPEFNFDKNYPAVEYEPEPGGGTAVNFYKDDKILEKNSLENYSTYLNNNFDINKQPIQEEDSYNIEKYLIPEIKEIVTDGGNKTRKKIISVDTPMLNTETTDFSKVFKGCWNLKSISTDIFSNNPMIITFDSCFYECFKLEKIPINIFAKNTVVEKFSWCFYECEKLIEIPDNLFVNNTLVKEFDFCFLGCVSLKDIPNELFKNNVSVINFNSCFSYCRNLTSIPSGLFDNNVYVNNFAGCFSGCTNLTSIPSGLFDNNINIYSLYSCFSECTNLTSIPSGLFDNNVHVSGFDGCFSNCTNLTSIPNGLFDNNVDVDSFSGCFSNCTSLTEIPSGLFDKNLKVEWFNTCFYRCTNLTNIPSGLFDNNVKAFTFERCFAECTNLITIPSGLFYNNIDAANFGMCFYSSSKAQLNKTIFSPITDYATRFAGKNIYFSHCFDKYNDGITSFRGEAPELWLYTYSTIDSYKCFNSLYDSTSTISNYTSIPANWK